ncbi:MAG TPA: hypothetical protein VNW97_15215 [Candidatus Saccharimonadales bacterium]|jgi:hypothetical protein|nr:hypothetical protein [Candidatus Saccharimonadales bacterium]
MPRKPGPRKQPSAIKCLEFIAQIHGYTVQTRKKNQKVSADEKTFLPDIIARPFRGNRHRVFEVEATVTNNTIYKSLLSLLTALKNGATAACLVVPDKRLDFASGCLSNLTSVIRYFSKPVKGAPLKIKLEVLGFSAIAKHHAKAKRYDDNRIGQPPKCPFLPRS